MQAVLKNSAFPQLCSHFEICQLEPFLRSRKVLYDPPSPRNDGFVVTSLERQKEKSLHSLTPSSKRLVWFLMLQHISVFCCTSRLFSPCQNMQGKAKQALQLLLSLDEKRERDRGTVNALDISRSYHCPTKEVRNIKCHWKHHMGHQVNKETPM